MQRSTPCIGICSTTYGDLVCRGCKRFAHEIVQWNGYQEEQRQQIRSRLRELSMGALQRYITVVDPLALNRFLALNSPANSRLSDQEPALLRGYECLRLDQQLDPAELGLEVHLGFAAGSARSLTSALGALETAVEAEFYARAQAHYERSFKVPMQ